jgi:iron complex outermembrane recepter protein
MFQRTKICSGLLLAFGGGLLSIAPGAFAQDTTVQRVEITGSSIKRVDAETSVPVTVIRADELKKAGVTSVEQVLQQVSSVQVQQTSAQAVGAGTGGASYADMRGLGANKTLVLLNGRRIANSAFSASAPDINTIPFAAIERVEVLRDGASALYGTDAIAGVINFITRRDYRGGTIGVGVDSPQHPGGSQHEAQFGFGGGDLEKDGLNLFGFVGFQKQASIGASQRHYFPHIVQSKTTFPGTYQITDGISGKTELFTPFATPNCVAPDNSLAPINSHQCGESTGSFVDYIPASERLTGYGKGSFKINENNTFAIEAFVAQSKVNSKIAPVPYGALYMDPSSPYYPGKGITPLPTGWTVSPDQLGLPGSPNDSRIFVKYRDVFNGYREDDNTTTQGRFVASLEGTVGDWDYNVAASLNTTRAQDYLSHGYSDINVLATQDTDPNSATFGGYVLDNAVNPFGTQTAAGASVLKAAQKNGVVQYGTGTVKDFDGHASRDLGDWTHSGRPAAIALGFEARDERFLQSANAEYAAQVVASTGIDPGTFNSGTRKVYAGYAELNVPIIKSLDITGALRYDHYSDFGSTTNPKVSFRFQPSKAILLRGSFSTGFRAPSLYELHSAQTYGNSTSGQNDPKNCPTGTPINPANTQSCDNQFEILTGGNLDLKAEKSKNATLGLVLEPINNLTAEFDFYHISITKEVGTLPDSTLFSVDGLAKFPGNFHYNPAGQLSTDGTQCPGTNCGYVDELNQNLGSVRTDGLDIGLGYKLNAGAMGRFNFDLQSTWVHSYKYQLVPGDAFIQNVGIFSNGSPVFRWQHNAGVTWNLDPFALGWQVHHKSGYIDFSGERSVSAYTTMDLYGSFAMAKGFSFTVGVKNLTDSKAPYTDYTGLFQTGYDPRYSDPTGRTYYGRATYSF